MSTTHVRELAHRWAAQAAFEDGRVTQDIEVNTLDACECEALLGFVRRTMADELERVRQGMQRIEARGFISGDCTVEPEPEWLSRVIANMLGLDGATALALCEAAGWPEVGS